MEELTKSSSTPDSVSGDEINSNYSVESLSKQPSQAPTSLQKHSGNRLVWVIVLILLFLGFLIFAGLYFQSQLQKTSMNASKTSTPPISSSALPNPLIIGTDPTLQPMEFMHNGKYVGYDIDLANLLGKQLGVKVEFKDITFDNLFAALDQKQIDMIIAAVTITSERQAKYDFSEPYLNAGQVIITQKTNTTIKSPADLKGKRIGVQEGTTNEAQALQYTSSNLVIKYSTFVQATQALVNGQVDAIFDDLPSSQGIISANPTLKIASDPFTNEYYGIVLRKGDPNIKRINEALEQLRERGYLTELKHKWLD